MKPSVRPGSSLFSLLSVSLFLFFAGAASAAIANGIDLRIHPIGDSITYGYRSSDNNGYRNALLSKLGGNKVQYIGSQHSGSMSQNANDGYSGFEIDGIAEKIGTALAQRPNVVLLMAGTNDINNNDNVSGAPGRLGYLLDRIISACPDAVIVLAKITPIADAAAESRAQAYNSAMVGVAQSRINAGHKIVMVDMQNAQTGLSAGDLVDGLHPTDTGYAKMATVWYNGMASAASSGLIAAPVAGAPISGGGQARCHGTVFWYNNYGTIASGVGQSDAPFESSWTLASAEHAFGNRGRGVRIADLDGDGLDDLIYIDNESGAATLSQNGGLMATGRIAWQDKGQIASGIGDGAGVRFADITGDGRADYIWISKDGDITAYVNNGPGGDGGWNWAPLGSVTRGLDKGTRDSIRFADLDGDGRADFSIVGDGGSLKSWIATGTASEPEWLPLGEIASGIGDAGGVQLYDLNGDGRADYIWVDNSTTMTAYMNLRAQNSLAPQWTPAGKIGTGFGINRADIIFGDLTGDGKADIKILDDSTDFTYINNGHGAAFQAGDQIVFADLDGDGFDDYISIGPDGSLLAYRNGGANSVANKGWVWIPWGTIASGVGKRHQIRYLLLALGD
jgi:lysophospholipase L1-like esterase